MKDFKLDTHPKISSGFKTPEHYFEGLPDRIMARLPEKKPRVIPLFRNKKAWIMSAAAIGIVSLMIPVLNNPNPEEVGLDNAAIENYLSYQSAISQYELAGMLDDKDLEKLETDIGIEDKTIEDILVSNTNFENYIAD